jgi:formamidopyrimidine-DNA glycosylase
MPELPEVEVFRKYFEQTALNKKIILTDLSAARMLKGIDADEFINHTEGYKFISALRHGKYMFASLNNNRHLMLHFGMTGYLVYYKGEEDRTSHIRLQFKLNNNFYIAYNNSRMFGSIMLLDDINEFILSKELGVDPINTKFTYTDFRNLTNGRSGTIKSLLMDQTLFAGIGNLYSDEIAYQAGIHPSTAFSSLKEESRKELYRKMVTILKTAVKKEGEFSAMPKTYLLNNRKEGSKCQFCGGKISHKTIAGRTSYFCTKHQK